MDFFETDPFIAPVDRVLDRNLEALGRLSPQAAARIRAATARTDIEFFETDEGVLSASMGGRLLASRRGPMTEAVRLADTVEITEVAGVAVTGFGLGHHLRVFAERMNRSGVLLCFEPDVGLLRAVLEKIDCTDWILRTNFALLTDPDDGASISRVLSGLEGVVALGVRIVDHPASRERLGDNAQRFGQRFTDVLKAIRTAIVTTLVQSEVTLRNLLMNLDHYAGCAGINDLASSCPGVPAVVVAAGPSLERNIDALARPGVRDRVVIIAVQTVLKTLLERGIKPHFVCALDHHEISTRFYEGLTAADVEGVTLVVEPKANPAILDAYPGVIRSLSNDLLDLALDGTGLGRQHKGELKPGATVAHLCCYLARHLGCDPVLLCGQDLGFTDGQYYAAGAAIHDVWAAELGPFNTLEMMEWQRIARQKSLLRRKIDVFGRPIYTDEQMSTYLAQFEADFLSDTEQGLRVIDATEGGVSKQHTVPMGLDDAIEAYGSMTPVALPGAERYTPTEGARATLRARMIAIRGDARKIHQQSRETVRLLRKLRRALDEPSRANDLISKIHKVRDEVTTLGAAFRMTQFINQSGTLGRVRADRAIDLKRADGERARQEMRVERDIANVEAIAEAADRLVRLLDATAESLAGGAKRTRDRVDALPGAAKARRRRVAAIVHVDFERGGLATTRDIESPIAGPHAPLRTTITRLLAARRLREIVCLTDDPARLARALGDLAGRVVVRPLDVARMRARIGVVGAARRFNPSAWRGGIGSLCCYDEVIEPGSCAAIMAERNIDAAVLVGADWCLTDPALIDALVERHAEHPEALRVVLSQAPPGLGSILVDRTAIEALATNAESAGPFATIGALLAYVPFAPQADPIAQPMCVAVPPAVRDLMTRCIPDTPHGRRVVAAALGALEPAAGCEAVALAIGGGDIAPSLPRLVEIEVGTNGLAAALAVVEQLEPGAAVTLRGASVEDTEGLRELVAAAHRAEVSVHVRTALAGEHWAELPAAGVDVVSVDLFAIEPVLYRAMTGEDRYEIVKDRVESLLRARNGGGGGGGLPRPWVVPRITRCDAAYEHIELFYDGWLRACGCAVIDPLEAPIGGRITALPLPAAARRRDAIGVLRVRADGSVAGSEGLRVQEASLGEIWTRVLGERGVARWSVEAARAA